MQPATERRPTDVALDDLTIEELDAMAAAELDLLPFGATGLDEAGLVEVYSAVESRYAGLPPASVLGRHFFTAVAPCMNNALVAARMEGEAELDATIDYVLTFRMRPTRVKVRLLKSPKIRRRYLLIQR